MEHFSACFCLCAAENEELRTCIAECLSDHILPTVIVFSQACTIIASSPVTFRNLIITSTISSAGVKVPSRLRGNAVVMIVILPRYALALQAAVKSSPLPFPDAFWSEYFYGFLQKNGGRGR